MRWVTLLATAMIGCNADSFVTADSGTDAAADASDAASDAAPSEGGFEDANPIVDAGNPKSLQCNTIDCTRPDVCCASAAWTSPACNAASVEGNNSCLDFLECNDSRQCTGTQICCATIDPTSGNAVKQAVCALTCSGSDNVRLCGSVHDGKVPNDCSGGALNCGPGVPLWLYSCQP